MGAGVGEDDPAGWQHGAHHLGELSGVDVAGDMWDVPGLVVLAVDVHRGQRADLGREGVGDRGEPWPGVGDQTVVDGVELPDLLGADIDLDQGLVVKEVLAQPESCVLIQRVADREDHVRLPERFPGAGVAAFGEHPDAQPMVLGDHPLAVQLGENPASSSTLLRPASAVASAAAISSTATVSGCGGVALSRGSW